MEEVYINKKVVCISETYMFLHLLLLELGKAMKESNKKTNRIRSNCKWCMEHQYKQQYIDALYISNILKVVII